MLTGEDYWEPTVISPEDHAFLVSALPYLVVLTSEDSPEVLYAMASGSVAHYEADARIGLALTLWVEDESNLSWEEAVRKAGLFPAAFYESRMRF